MKKRLLTLLNSLGIHIYILSFLIFFTFLPPENFAFAAENKPSSAAEKTDKLDTILVHSHSDSHLGIHKDHSVTPVQAITKEEMDKKNHGNLNEMIDVAPGVDVQDYCVNCGAKRLTINGLRGEHTNILIDGIPLFSSISSVYGIDTISTLSIQEIDVLRGAGSALIHPESIAGGINLITVDPLQSGGKFSYQHSTHNNQMGQWVYHKVGSQSKWSLGGDFDWQNYWDEDQNNVSEFPTRERFSLFATSQTQLNPDLKLRLRGSYSHLQVLGGSSEEVQLNRPITLQANESDFENGDVRRPYTGDPRKIADNVEVHRADLQGQLRYSLNPAAELESNFGAAYYTQNAIYSHAFDYDNQSPIFYIDTKWSQVHNENLFTVFGVSHRQEYLRSESVVMYDTEGLPKDDFNYFSSSVFAQLDWHVFKNFEVASALRLDHLNMNRKNSQDIIRTVLAPRINAKYTPSENTTHFLSYGMGYRMPLSFTEAAHGTYDGFIVATDLLEYAHSFVYMLSVNHENFYFTPSLHYTLLQNMTYDRAPEVAHSAPIEFLNDNKDHHITVAEILAGYKPIHEWLLEFSFENFFYDNDYKSKLPTAAVEQRLGFKSSLEWKNWQWNLNLSYVLPRDLSQYAQYDEFYNVYGGGIFGVSNSKRLKAPGFVLLNTSVNYKWDQMEFTLGVLNLFNDTQVKRGDSPAVWHFHDNHAHFDNRHTWGLNRGREGYFKLSYNF